MCLKRGLRKGQVRRREFLAVVFSCPLILELPKDVRGRSTKGFDLAFMGFIFNCSIFRNIGELFCVWDSEKFFTNRRLLVTLYWLIIGP